MLAGQPVWQPKTETERQLVLKQLERLLRFAAFSRSSRYPRLLRYLVEYTLASKPEHLKERTIGMEVFSRVPDYDTNDDPVVRVTASEVRKRIAQYYHEPGHEDELRIELLPFSYVPVFQWPQGQPTLLPFPVEERTPPAERGRRWQPALLWAASILAAAGICLGWMRGWGPRSPSESFWKPLLVGGSPVIVAIGTPEFGTISLKNAPPASVGPALQDPRHVAFPDVYSVSLVAGFLGQHNKPLEVRDSSLLSFTDLQNGPAVMVGGFNNPWTLRATSHLRFHFVLQPFRAVISDSRDPTAETWFVDRALSVSERTEDYGIVARFTSQETNEPTIVAAGIGGSGTIAASQFLTDPKYRSLLAQNASSGRNVELVLATQIIGGKPGPPHIVATHYW